MEKHFMGHSTGNACPVEPHVTSCNGHLLNKLASFH